MIETCEKLTPKSKSSRNFLRQNGWNVMILYRLTDLLLAVVNISVYSKLPNTKTHGTADSSSVLHSFYNIDFIICLITVKECLSLIQRITRSLQERQIDAGCVLASFSFVKNSLQNFANKAGSKQSVWFQRFQCIVEELHVALKKSGICLRQTNRANIPTDAAEEYLKNVISIPFLDHLPQKMETSFIDLHKPTALDLMLVPSDVHKLKKING